MECEIHLKTKEGRIICDSKIFFLIKNLIDFASKVRKLFDHN